MHIYAKKGEKILRFRKSNLVVLKPNPGTSIWARASGQKQVNALF